MNGGVQFQNPTVSQTKTFQQVASQNAQRTEGAGLRETAPSVGQRMVNFFKGIAASIWTMISGNRQAPKAELASAQVSGQSAFIPKLSVPVESQKSVSGVAKVLSGDLKTFLSQQSPDKLKSMSLAELKTCHAELKSHLEKLSDDNMARISKDKGLSEDDVHLLKQHMQPGLDAAQKFHEALTSVAADKTVDTLLQKSASEVQNLSEKEALSVLKALDCSPSQCAHVAKTLTGLKTVATDYGASKAEAGRIFNLLTPENKGGMARVCAETLGKSSEGQLFLKRAGSEIQSARFDTGFANAQAADLIKGDYSRLVAIQDHVSATTSASIGTSTRLEATVLKMALSGTEANQEKTMIQHTLRQISQTLTSSITFETAGKDTKLNSMKSMAFSETTVKALLARAKPEDKANYDLLFGYTMILQHKLDHNEPMSKPASAELTSKLQRAGIDFAGDLQHCVESGFKSSSEVSSALSFVTHFSARISNCPDFMETMQSLVEHPLTDITHFQAAVVKQSLGMGGIDANQAAAFIQQSNTLAQKVIQSKGTEGSSAQDKAMGVYRSFSELSNTVSHSIFDFRKGISGIEDRLKRLEKDTQRLEDATQTIKHCTQRSSQIQKHIDKLSQAELPSGVAIRHVRQFNNAKLASQELQTLGALSQFSSPDQGVVRSDLIEKFKFSAQPSMLSRSLIPFKTQDMPSFFKPVQDGDKTYLGLFQLSSNAEGKLEEKLMGYVDPKANQADLARYAQNMRALIQHAEASDHTNLIKSASSQATFNPDNALEKDRLQVQDLAVQRELQPAIDLKRDSEGKLALNLGGDKDLLPTAQKAIRLAISELCRDRLSQEGLHSFEEKLSEFTDQLKTDPTLQAQVSAKIDAWGLPPIETLVKKECLQFEGSPSFKQWTQEVEPRTSADTSLDQTAQANRQSRAYRSITNQDKVKAQEVVGGLRNEGDCIHVKMGGRWEVTTGELGKAAMAVFTGGTATTSITAKREQADAVVLRKTNTGFRLEMSETHMKSLGLNTIFGGIAAVGTAAQRDTHVGYHLEFDSAHKASEFLWALTSGNTDSVQDASCLGLASAVHLSTGKSLNLSLGVGVQIAPPIPTLGEQNFGSIQLQVSGERREEIQENKESRTVTTTTQSEQGIAFNAEGMGKLISLATNESINYLRNQGYVKGENISSAALKKSESVSVTHSHAGLLQAYTVKEQISCGMFGMVQMGSFSPAEWVMSQLIVPQTQGDSKQYPSLTARISDTLDTLTKGNADLKAQAFELIRSATPEHAIGVEKQLSPDSLFEMNGLLSPFGEGNTPKSAEQLKQDKATAQQLIDNPANYVITGLSLSKIDQIVDHSHVNAIAPIGVDLGATGIVDHIDVVQGSYTTLQNIHFND